MPHLILEYSAGISPNVQTLEELNRLLADFESITLSELKSRALKREIFSVGEGGASREFVHLQLALLPGRPPELKQRISKALLEYIKAKLPPPAGQQCSYSVELRELEKDSYSKFAL